MKFAHMADCHIGGWSEPKIREINTEAFIVSIDKCIASDVDFVLISGDLFNTSLPAMDCLKTAVKKLKELKNNNIPAYIIAGSHDFSPTGKTMIDILYEAGLCINVVKGDKVLTEKYGKLVLKFVQDQKTGAKITGMLGKRGMLEKVHYEDLYRKNLEEEIGYKIFMFHTAITELKPKELENMDSSPISLLPKGFDYYAGGHVHIIRDEEIDGYKQVVYPGPLFPNSFKELEDLGCGGFYIVEDNNAKYIPIEIYKTHKIVINCKNKPAEIVRQEILDEIKDNDLKDKIVLIRLKGTLSSGMPRDLDFRDIFNRIYEKKAYFVMKNTSALDATELEEIKIKAGSTEDIESALIKEHIGQIKVNWINDEEDLTKTLINLLDTEKHEGEKVHDFEERVKDELDKVIGR